MKKICSAALLGVVLLNACTKTDINFGADSPGDDPDIAYYDDYNVKLATWVPDSFITSGSNDFAIGFHDDPLFGKIKAGLYSRFSIPVSNDIKDQKVQFDSLVLELGPNGSWYGDTTKPVLISAYPVTEAIENEESSNTSFYYPRSFAYQAASLGQTQQLIRPTADSLVHIRLADQLGMNLLQALQSNTEIIQDDASFAKYFPGLFIGSDSSLTNVIYSFSSDNFPRIALHYRQLNVYSEEKTTYFPANAAGRFTHIEQNRTGTSLTAFRNGRTQLIASDSTGGMAYLNSFLHHYIKISFDNIWSLKEKFPHLTIVKAILEIPPVPGTYNYPYPLASPLYLYGTGADNDLQYQITDATGQSALTGDLNLDKLYGESTGYQYDITSFLTLQLNEGNFSDMALMLTAGGSSSFSTLNRLLINQQGKESAIKLKLYVLGI